MLVGKRAESRPAEAMARRIAKALGAISHGLTDFRAQDVGVISRAVVSATVQCAEGKHEGGVWMLEQADIVRLGRTEWKEQ